MWAICRAFCKPCLLSHAPTSGRTLWKRRPHEDLLQAFEFLLPKPTDQWSDGNGILHPALGTYLMTRSLEVNIFGNSSLIKSRWHPSNLCVCGEGIFLWQDVGIRLWVSEFWPRIGKQESSVKILPNAIQVTWWEECGCCRELQFLEKGRKQFASLLLTTKQKMQAWGGP